MFDWMRNQRRAFPLRQLGTDGFGGNFGNEFCTMRPEDNRFYWLSTSSISPRYVVPPDRWSNLAQPATLTGRIDPQTNDISSEDLRDRARSPSGWAAIPRASTWSISTSRSRSASASGTSSNEAGMSAEPRRADGRPLPARRPQAPVRLHRHRPPRLAQPEIMPRRPALCPNPAD